MHRVAPTAPSDEGQSDEEAAKMTRSMLMAKIAREKKEKLWQLLSWQNIKRGIVYLLDSATINIPLNVS
jgi:hypothetical protein